jgi:DNA-binding CsgD family transcriptional regulator/tetratricopeptide (TPR) repeat protein
MRTVAGRISSPELVGREDALAALRAALTARPADPRPVVLVAGDAGIGKSRLLDEFVASIAADPPVQPAPVILRGACPELTGGQLPFAPILDMLVDLERRGGSVGVAAAPLRLELAGATEAAEPVAAMTAGPVGFGRSSRFQRVHDVLAAVADEGPTVAIVDDLHWADQSTLDLLTYLADRVRDRPILLVLAFRSDELSRRHPLRPVLANLARAATLDRLDLRPLDDGDVARQVAAIVGGDPDPALLARWTDLADGNPFYVEELVALNAESVLPPSLRDVLGARLDVLDDASASVVGRAAVIGRRFDLGLLEAVAATAGPEAGSAASVGGLAEAVEARILEADPDGSHYRFRHALLREAAYEDLLPAERIALHRTIAATLAEHPELADVGPSGSAAEIAYHWEAGRAPNRALPAFVAAARAALNAFAWAEARAAAEKSLELWSAVAEPAGVAGWPRSRLLHLAANAAWWSGDTRRALVLLTDALNEGDVLADPMWAGAIAIHRSWCLGELDDREGALAAVEWALSVIPQEPPSSALSDAVMTLATRRGAMGAVRESIDLAWRSYEIARACGASGSAANSAAVAADGHAQFGREAKARAALALSGESFAEAPDNLIAVTTVTSWLPWVYLALGSYSEAIGAADSGFEVARRIGAEWGLGPWMTAVAVESPFWSGAWDEAEAKLASIGSFAQADVVDCYLAGTRARIAALRGERDVVERELAVVWALVRRSEVQDVTYAVASTAIASRFEDDRDRLLGRLARGRSMLADCDSPYMWGLPATFAGHACADVAERAARSGDRARAQAARAEGEAWIAAFERVFEAQREADEAQGLEWPPDGRALAMWRTGVHGAAARLAGAPDPSAFRELGEQAGALGNRIVTMLARVEQARALFATGGSRSEAAGALAAAAELAAGVGAGGVLADVGSIAGAARLPLPDGALAEAASSDPWGLSPREREVLALVAGGRTNREIGEALFISDKTASVHVTHILAKLGVGSRTEAALLAVRGAEMPAISSDSTG